MFTASTLSVFAVKKAYTKNHRMRTRRHDRESDPDTAQGLHTVRWFARSTETKTLWFREKVWTHSLWCVDDQNPHGVGSKIQTSRCCVKHPELKLAPHDPLIVDARNVVLPGNLLKWVENPCAQSALYIAGVVGLSATAIVWIMIPCHQ